MKKKSIQRIAAWLLAAGMMAGTFAQPMAVYAESTASIAASDSTTGDSITADADGQQLLIKTAIIGRMRYPAARVTRTQSALMKTVSCTSTSSTSMA